MDHLPWGNPGRFWRGNLHCHSTLSDGRLPLDQVIGAYRTQGYDFLAVTEHFSARYGFPVADTRPFRTATFTTLIGAELDAPGSTIGETWYLNALGLPLDFAPVGADETLPEIAARARAAGAFVAAACPYWSGMLVDDIMRLDAIHAIETDNATAHGHNDRGDSWHLLDGALALGRRLSGLAVDDAHFTVGWPDWFQAWVMVRAERLDPDALLAALLAGHFYSTQGPVIHGLTVEGGTLRVACSPAAAIVVSGRGRGRTGCMGRPSPPPSFHSRGSLARTAASRSSTGAGAAPGRILSGWVGWRIESLSFAGFER